MQMLNGIIVQKCVNCGFCCMLAPCAYGKRNPDTGWCFYLVLSKQGKGYEQYVCQKYEEIKNTEGSWLHPAFGAGCSSTLFNERRNRVVIGLKNVANNNSSP